MANVNDDDENDLFISDHSQSMRKASDYCITLFRQWKDQNATINTSTHANQNSSLGSILHLGQHDVGALFRASEEHQARRNKAHQKFWSYSSSQHTSTNDRNPSIACSAPGDTIPVQTKTTTPAPFERIRVRTERNDYSEDIDVNCSICSTQVRHFKDRFQNLNIPCLITGLDRTSHFRFVNKNWKSQKNNAVNDFSTGPSKVNRKWFLDELGEECLVPLRYSPRVGNQGDSCSEFSLDEDGRAMECETKEVCMKEWIHMLTETQYQREKSVTNAHFTGCNKINQENTIYYLKDWHLQQRYPLANAGNSTCGKLPVRSRTHSSCLLYDTPEFFGHDLLNSFLTRFTTGDYRFCYWGPSGSFTARHSDVLHSFSWSYNVVGTKEWTFFYNEQPDTNGDEMQNELKTFTIVQETGQTIFVPATWQHKVANLEETISINHNWITSANLDLVWDCLKVEMEAIRNELQGWGGNSDGQGLDQNMEACENMLRGCLGLDVTSFVLMTLIGLLESITTLLPMLMKEPEMKIQSEPNGDETRGDLTNEQEGLLFDAFRMASVLQDVMTIEESLLRFQDRLSAVLQSKDKAQTVQRLATEVIDWMKIT